MGRMDEHIARAKELYKDFLEHKEVKSMSSPDKHFVAFMAAFLSQKEDSPIYSNHPHVQPPHLNDPSHGFVPGNISHSVHGDSKSPFITLNAQWFFDEEVDHKLVEANRILRDLSSEWKIKEYYINGVKSLFTGKIRLSENQFDDLRDGGCITLIYKNERGQFLRVEVDVEEGDSDEERPSMNFSLTSYYPNFNQEVHSLEYDFLGQAKNDFALTLNRLRDTTRDGSWIPSDIDVYEAADWNGKIDCSHLNPE